MSEKFHYANQEDRKDASESIKDFVKLDKNGNALAPAGSGYKSNKRMSDYEIQQVEAHASQIYDGLENKETEEVLENVVGILTDPNDIRDSFYENGLIDDEEKADLSDEEILAMVDEMRERVDSYYGESPDSQQTPEPAASAAPGRHRRVNRRSFGGGAQPSHRLVNRRGFGNSNATGTTNTPSTVTASTGQQQGAPRHRARTLRERMANMLTPAGAAAELQTAWLTAKERLGNHPKTKLALGVLAVGAAVGAYYLFKESGTHHGGNFSGTGLKDILPSDSPTPTPTGGAENVIAPTVPKASGDSLSWGDLLPKARNVTNGEGWYNTFKEMGIPKEHWSNVLDIAGPKLQKLGEAYYDSGAREWRINDTGKLSEGALKVIAAASKRDGYNLAA